VVTSVDQENLEQGMSMARSNLLSVRTCCYGVALLASVSSVGCQSDYAGQTLPSAYWQKDDIQYFPPGPEFKLSREAAAMKAYGTGRASKPAVGPLGPGDGPAPGGDLPGIREGAPGAAGVPAPPPPGANVFPPAGAAEVPPDAGAMPPADGAAEADPFNP
jgi:hypothetical protein